MIRTQTRRPGFTLVELLVAIALAIAILALAIGVSQSSAFDSYKTVGAADKVSQWLITSKNKALRDKAPRGVRFITSPDGFVREVAFIEQPDPIPSNGPLLAGTRLIFYYPAYVQENTVAMPATRTVTHDPPFPTPQMGAPASPSNVRAVYLAGLTAAQQNDLQATVQGGDLISVPELRTVLRLNPTPITVFAPAVAANMPGGATVQLNVTPESLPELGKGVYSYHNSSTLTNAMGTTFHPSIPQPSVSGTLAVTTFALIRGPRPLLGEPTQLLPNGMAVDVRRTVPHIPQPPPATLPPTVAVTTSWNAPSPDGFNNIDILFAPTGEVIGATESLTALLVRDVNLPNTTNPLTTDYNAAGQMILICVYNRTGAISTQPVNPPPAADPYQFAKDGLNTGL
jgi:hypothetical protein